MKLHLIVVGKLKTRYLKEGCDDFASRCAHDLQLTVTEVPDEPLRKENASHIAKVLEKEAFSILKVLKPSFVMVWDVAGKAFSSEGLAETFQTIQSHHGGSLTMIIGGSYGLHPDVLAQASLRVSLSNMTFPHGLARLMVLEQTYRAVQILNHRAYHK